MIDWIIEKLPFLNQFPIIIGSFLIIFTSIIFLLKLESFNQRLNESKDLSKDDSSKILSKLLFPLCTALPNFIFAFAAINRPQKAYLVLTSNLGNNVTNITLFAGLIMLIGFMKNEEMIKKERQQFQKDYNFLLVSTIIFFVCIWDGNLTRHEGIIMTLCFLFSMADIFQFKFKEIRLIFLVFIKMAPMFLLFGGFIYLGSELIIQELDKMGEGINSKAYEVLLPGLILVLPSIMPLLLAMTKSDSQQLALSGVIGDCAFSIPLITGILGCFQENIKIEQSLINYMLITAIVSFGFFHFTHVEKGKIPLWKVTLPFLGYIGILIYSVI